MAKVLFVDNFDSFTYNLVEEFKLLGHELVVARNNLSVEQLNELALASDLVVISPGPGNPKQAGNCLNLLKDIDGKRPVLGICLGHQLIVEYSGGRVMKASVPVHGKSSLINIKSHPCFSDLANPLCVGRYHSLSAYDLPDSLSVIAEYEGLIMAVYKEDSHWLGFQFHPESILTTKGSQLLRNSIDFLLVTMKR